MIVLESIADSMDEETYTPTEKKLMHKLRTMLKDLPTKNLRSLNTLVESSHGERWSDSQLIIYLEMAIGDINAEPPYTNFSLNNFPSAIETTVVLGATVFALISESILQVGEFISRRVIQLLLTTIKKVYKNKLKGMIFNNRYL